jgi:hypothetical protein
MAGAESKPSAEEILSQMQDLAALSSVERPALSAYGIVRNKFRTVYNNLIPATETAITAETLRANTRDTYLSGNFDGILNAVSRLRVPNTDIPLFLRGGSYSLFNEEGVFEDFVEERVGLGYENDHNAAAYTLTKPAVLYMLRALKRTPDISYNTNTRLIANCLNLPESSVVHMGGLIVDSPFSLRRKWVMGISSAELTEEAIQHLKKTFIENESAHSIDPSGDDGHYTAAGFMDELAGKVAVAHLRGYSETQMQTIAHEAWYRLMATAIPGPLPPQYH